MKSGVWSGQVDTIAILIADDHAVVREGTRKILEHESDFTVVAEASDGDEAVRMTGAFRPDVAIIDISMPVLNGLEATRQIKAQYPSVAVLILTAFDDDQLVFGLLEAGAAGYLLKSIRGRELVDAVRRVHAGESVLHPSIARKVLNRFTAAAAPVHRAVADDILTDRETEVLQMCTWGLSNQEIADRLVLSLHTIQAHLGHIFNKLNVGSRTEAVVCGLRRGWVTLEEEVPGSGTRV
jgi:NarL family two-component system response regulator LiaR